MSDPHESEEEQGAKLGKGRSKSTPLLGRTPLYWAPYNGKNRHKTIIATIAHKTIVAAPIATIAHTPHSSSHSLRPGA